MNQFKDRLLNLFVLGSQSISDVNILNCLIIINTTFVTTYLINKLKYTFSIGKRFVIKDASL